MVIHKIGIVPVARMRDADGRMALHVLIHKPKPKGEHTDADIAWGLARGTRMYFDVHANEWVDARDRAVAEDNKDRLEAPVQTALREMGEELDVCLDEFEGGALTDIGEIHYDSQQRGAYPIHWFSGVITNPERMRAPQDAAAVKWVSLEGLRAMEASGEFKASYVPIAEVIAGKMGKEEFRVQSSE